MDEGEIRTATAEERARGLDCLRCGNVVQAGQQVTLRTGGVHGGWGLLLGNLADIGEGTIELNAYACPGCGHVEFRLPDRDRS